MHLLSFDKSGELRLTKPSDDKHPPYAILSHTWGDEDAELTFKDVQDGLGKSKAGFQKVIFCGQQAQKDDLLDFWVDSCCINRSDSSELSESIISMFRWYKQAAKCYVYLSDVTALKRGNNGDTACNWQDAFRKSRWYTRGWTLQELLAPNEVEFWSRDGQLLGTKQTLKDLIYEITKIPAPALCGTPLSDFSVNERHRWAAKRDTTRKEDKAYCLLGIFDVFMPPMYGEGDNASQRLQDNIKLRFGDVRSGSGNQTGSNYEDSDDHRESVLASLRFEQMDTRRSTVKNAQQKTCAWMVQHPAYVAWRLKKGCSEDQRTLWIAGKPGAGKSTIMKYLYDNTNQSKHDDEIVISFFFNARGDQLERTTVGMYRALLAQILVEVQDLQNLLDEQDPSSEWTTEALKRIFADAINGLGGRRLTCFIDALDECDEQQIRDMVEFFDDVQDSTQGDSKRLFICFASRHYPTIEIRSGQRLVLEDEDGHSEDLWKYIRRRLRAGKGKLVDDIKAQVHEKANGVFMWVVLVINILNDEFSRGRIFAVKQRLKEIPGDLSALFRDLLRRDSANMDDLLLCIQWVLFARRPLRMQEFYFAMVAGLNPERASEPWNQDEVTSYHMTRFVQSSSKGLAEVTKSKTAPQVQFIHESVNDFLLTDGGLQELWPDLGNGERSRSISHERLKNCCLHQVAADFSSSTSMSFAEPLPKAKSEEDKRLREEMSAVFPFVAYASSGILYHANEAARAIAEETFLLDFPLDRWVYLSNLYTSHQIRRHSSNVALLYVLAENGLHRLIRAIPFPYGFERLPLEKYQYSLMAAYCNGHKNAFFTLLGITGNSCAPAIESDPGFGKASQISKTVDLLLWATDHRNWVLAECLLICGHQSEPVADPLQRKQDGNDALSLAARYGKINIVGPLFQYMLEASAPRRAEIRPEYLVCACEGGHMRTAQLLLEQGASINAECSERQCLSKYRTALEAALAEEHENLVRLLIDRGISVVAQQSALANASRKGRVGAVEILLRQSAKVDRGSLCSALWAASAGGHQKVFEILLECGADVSPPIDGPFRLALEQASAPGHDHIVERLLDRSKDVAIEQFKTSYGTALTDACRRGFEHIMGFLLLSVADANARSVKDENALKTACYKGYEKMVQPLIAHDADVNARSELGSTALGTACYEGFERIVQLLLDYGADVYAPSGKEGTPLEAACYNGHQTVVQLLLDHDANVYTAHKDHSHALLYACRNGHVAVVRLLLHHGAAANAPHEIRPLIEACGRGHEVVVRLLLDHGADANARHETHGNALITAYIMGYKAIVRLLLDHGADANTQHKIHGSALTSACVNGHVAVVRLLLDYNADAHAQNEVHGSPLIAACINGNEAVARLLLDHDADVNARNEIHGNPLIAACINGNEAVARLLLDYGADINAEKWVRGNALMGACEKGREAVVRLLLDHGADANAQNESYGPALTAACVNGYEAVARLPLDHGADINAENLLYGNALMGACEKGCEAVVRLLLDYGADVNASHLFFGTALDIAKSTVPSKRET
ncbi:unnamed protein product [Cercospora beticola]|nr:unnamed protein product [Cercospora beticola]